MLHIYGRMTMVDGWSVLLVGDGWIVYMDGGSFGWRWLNCMDGYWFNEIEF